jgi:hypothetical protein
VQGPSGAGSENPGRAAAAGSFATPFANITSSPRHNQPIPVFLEHFTPSSAYKAQMVKSSDLWGDESEPGSPSGAQKELSREWEARHNQFFNVRCAAWASKLHAVRAVAGKRAAVFAL